MAIIYGKSCVIIFHISTLFRTFRNFAKYPWRRKPAPNFSNQPLKSQHYFGTPNIWSQPQKSEKVEFPARKIQKNLIMNNFDCSSIIPLTQKLNFIPISPKTFFHSTSKFKWNFRKVIIFQATEY